VAGSCEHGNEPWGSIKSGKVLDHLGAAPWSLIYYASRHVFKCPGLYSFRPICYCFVSNFVYVST
jgi:hypothetical protein